jgi:hypothetical protein
VRVRERETIERESESVSLTHIHTKISHITHTHTSHIQTSYTHTHHFRPQVEGGEWDEGLGSSVHCLGFRLHTTSDMSWRVVRGMSSRRRSISDAFLRRACCLIIT